MTADRPLRLEGIDPDRAYSTKEIKTLREKASRSEDAPPVIRKIHKKGTAAEPLRGKLDVREAAARLPDEPAETESLDATEEIAEDLPEGGTAGELEEVDT